jgi:hypothetical protein
VRTETVSADARSVWAWMRILEPLTTPSGDDGEAQWTQRLRNLPVWLQQVTSRTPFMRRLLNEKRAELERLQQGGGTADDQR